MVITQSERNSRPKRLAESKHGPMGKTLSLEADPPGSGQVAVGFQTKISSSIKTITSTIQSLINDTIAVVNYT